jgi:hypothetical protein
MTALLRSLLNTYSFKRLNELFAVVLLALLSTMASAQTVTTTISGTVYDPRTTTSSLPLPNVLVYITTGTVDPLTAGVQCLTSMTTPAGAISYTNTAVDGTFTLSNVPVNTSYTLVIQAGKWRRQFSETVLDTAITGLTLHMPSTHLQGDIPLIAIATGSVDALECVLLNMGIAQSEFVDDNDTTGGRIHLYKGSSSPGVQISSTTPTETTLMGTATDATLLNSYDVVMFPCQGNPSNQATTVAATNLLGYANAGGRVFATHYSYAWLNPNSPYDSQFPPVANWVLDTVPSDGPATINTGFTDGATLAQWLLNAGASTSFGQVALSTVKNDISGVIPPTQSWAKLNSDGDIMQMTFNTPVGAAAANQCGRVLFNEYHVVNGSSPGATFPIECPASTVMTPQEEMLEYALFDLSSFVTPVIVPTLGIVFNPSPLVVNQGDAADQVTIQVTNTSTTTAIDSTPMMTITLPTGLTPTSLTDVAGNWSCTLSTLTCIRTAGIPAGDVDSVVLTVSVPVYTSGVGTSGTITATISSPNFSNNVPGTDTVIFQQQPPIVWATPAPIIYGTPLSGIQLDATSQLAGSFSYTPVAGTVLAVGTQTLKTTFTPADTTHYATATASVSLTVLPATPSATLTSSANPIFATGTVTFTDTLSVSGAPTAPTGTVTFYDGTTSIGSGTVAAGVATFTTTTLAAGAHSITAVYSGDSSYSAVTSSIFVQTIQDFTITYTGGSTGAVTVPAGGQALFPMMITPLDGSTLPGEVSLTLSGLESQATASFTPVTVASGSTATMVMLTVSLPSQSMAKPPQSPFHALPVALGLILLPLAGLRRKTLRRWQKMMVLALAGGILSLGLSGCGANVAPKSYTYTVTATSGLLSHTLTVKMTVQ